MGYIIGILAIGMLAGFMSSMVGIGGGIVIVPAMVFIFGMSQKMAQGTSLAMLLPPIGILGVINYHKAGLIDMKVAAILCVSFVLGSYLGSKVVLDLDSVVVKRIFAIFMIVVAVKYLFFDK
ncbi:MAG: sulfite exporter TauE/SafE family protein [Chitinophagales bacterium]|nr:sulfite exporter TauE/SafE family protein [Chitinophagales bacterium]